VTRVLLRGGQVHTPADPAATALLVDGDTVSWTGSDSAAADLAAGGGPDLKVVQLEGALVTPAFVDAHVHATSTGIALEGLDLTGCPSLAAALDRLEQHARHLRGGVILGHGWDETRWPGYYFRADKPKMDEANWHAFANCKWDPKTGEWEMIKRDVVPLIP